MTYPAHKKARRPYNAFQRGYEKALADINKPMAVIIKAWSPSVCPRCYKSFEDFEPCNDGYYRRAMTMQRCPYCGQMLDWIHLDITE